MTNAIRKPWSELTAADCAAFARECNKLAMTVSKYADVYRIARDRWMKLARERKQSK